MTRDWTEGEVAVVGLGKSGQAAATLLRRKGASVYASDVSLAPSAVSNAKHLQSLGIAVDVGLHDMARIARARVVVASPGVPPDAPPMRAARDAEVDVVSEVELALSAMPHLRYIAVTGTNGKTTVTALTAHLLRAVGEDAVAAGNIGMPLSEVALAEKQPSWVALEVSSFQLHDTPSIRPDVGVLTNLSPDHLDRYASAEAYYADKALLFRNATRHSRWVINADDAAVREMTAGVAGTVFRFSGEGRLADAFWDRRTGMVIVEDEPFLARKDLKLLGTHNVANALAAALAVLVSAPSHDTLAAHAKIAQGLKTFEALEHRLEPVGERHGILWINDSKATNVASARVAIESMTRPAIVLLGGRHKGEPYTGLMDALRQHGRAVVAYGESADRIAHDLGGHATVHKVSGSFADAVRKARSLAHRGDAILLAPACSSYDMFTNYEERGRAFAELAEQLGAGA